MRGVTFQSRIRSLGYLVHDTQQVSKKPQKAGLFLTLHSISVGILKSHTDIYFTFISVVSKIRSSGSLNFVVYLKSLLKVILSCCALSLREIPNCTITYCIPQILCVPLLKHSSVRFSNTHFLGLTFKFLSQRTAVLYRVLYSSYTSTGSKYVQMKINHHVQCRVMF